MAVLGQWDPLELDGTRVLKGGSHRLPGRVELCGGTLDENDYLEPGWKKCTLDARFPTLPGRRPGLELCPPDAVDRWKSDSHPFPP